MADPTFGVGVQIRTAHAHGLHANLHFAWIRLRGFRFN
jgi:hypothetical protein